eukprot:251141_1
MAIIQIYSSNKHEQYNQNELNKIEKIKKRLPIIIIEDFNDVKSNDKFIHTNNECRDEEHIKTIEMHRIMCSIMNEDLDQNTDGSESPSPSDISKTDLI